MAVSSQKGRWATRLFTVQVQEREITNHQITKAMGMWVGKSREAKNEGGCE